jgi:hypothetical protein
MYVRNSESFPIITNFPSSMNKQRYVANNRQLFSKPRLEQCKPFCIHLKEQEMLSDLPYIQLTPQRFRLKIQGGKLLERTALKLDVNLR